MAIRTENAAMSAMKRIHSMSDSSNDLLNALLRRKPVKFKKNQKSVTCYNFFKFVLFVISEFLIQNFQIFKTSGIIKL